MRHTYLERMSHRRSSSSIAAVLLALTLAGCSAGAPNDDGSTGLVEVAPAPPAPGAAQLDDSTGAADGNTLEPDGGTARPGTAQDRAIVRSASVELTVTSARAAATDAARIASDVGGIVESQSLASDGQSAQFADLTLRVPAEKLDEAIAALTGLGEVRSETRTSDDVTEATVDLEARVTALTASIERLTDLMAGAATTSELIEAESALAQRQQDLDGLNAQLESLKGQVEMASVWVSLREASALPGGGPQTFWDAILVGMNSIGSFFVGLVIALGVALPWLVLAAVIGFAILIPIRRRRRRARIDAPPGKALSKKPADSVATDDTP